MQRTANENVAGSRRICKRWSYGWSSSESIITKSTSSCPITKSSIMGFSFSFLFFFVLNFTRRYQWYFSFFVTFWTKQIIQRRVIIPQVHSFNKVKPCSAISCLDELLNTQISCCNSLFIFFSSLSETVQTRVVVSRVCTPNPPIRVLRWDSVNKEKAFLRRWRQSGENTSRARTDIGVSWILILTIPNGGKIPNNINVVVWSQSEREKRVVRILNSLVCWSSKTTP